jgi:hypothetical protein
MLGSRPECRQLSGYAYSGGRAACPQHISRSRQSLYQGATFRSPNVRRSPSCTRRVMVCEPSLVSSIALHVRSLVSLSAMWRAATALQNTGQPRHNGMPIVPPDGQSRRSWRPILSCGIMCRTGLPVRSRGRTEHLLSARSSCGTGAGPCIDRIDAGRRHGARNRFLAAFGSTFPRMRQCASVTKRSIRRFMCKAEERCAANCRPACAPGERCGCRGCARAGKAGPSFLPRS